jgi:hypothetical protein
VVDLCEEADFGRGHGVVIWKEEFELEGAFCITEGFVSFHLGARGGSGGYVRSYGDWEGPSIVTSKYRRLSSWGTALMPGTLDSSKISEHSSSSSPNRTHGSAIKRSVSLMILFGSAAMF